MRSGYLVSRGEMPGEINGPGESKTLGRKELAVFWVILQGVSE